jgi:topoisomerase IA-like protein
MEGDKKPKRVSVPKNVAPDSVDMGIALQAPRAARDLGRIPKAARRWSPPSGASAPT